jgi:RNA polymerase sigma factor (TIGR02999 family)
MGNESNQPLTQLLREWQAGDGHAFEELLSRTFIELQRMAAGRLRHDSNITISPSELLNEAVIKLMQGESDFHNRAHFFATVSLHMRTVLVDHARARHAGKRGGGAIHVTLTNASSFEHSIAFELIAFDEALTELEKVDARAAMIMHLTYFAGLEREAVADVVGVSIPTVDRELRFVRAWLSERLGHDIN